MERKSSKNLRHKTAVSEYLKFQKVQQKQETLDKIATISSKLLPRPGEFLVCSSALTNTSGTLSLSDFNKTGLLRPSSSSILRNSFYQELIQSRPGTGAILTNQLRNITKPQIPEMLTLSSIAMVNEEQRPGSGALKNIDWKQARDLEVRPKTRSEYSSSNKNSKTPSLATLPRPSTSIPKNSERNRVVIKKDFNIKKNNPGEGFSVTTPLDLFIQEAKEELGRSDNTKFLPLEMYNPHADPESPRSFIKSIQQRHGKAVAYSKWFFADGTYQWKKCTILGFDEKIERFSIQWENGAKKHASRINIRLLEESEEEFENRLKSAGTFRDKAEIIMKYVFYIESMTTPTTPLPLKVVDCIINRIFTTKKISPKEFRVALVFKTHPADEQHNTKRMLWAGEITHMVCEQNTYLKLGFADLAEYKEHYFRTLKPFELKFLGNKATVSQKILKSLIEEVEENSKYAQHKFEFDADLPYNLEKQELFAEILPRNTFLVPQDRPIVIPEKTIIYTGFDSNLECISEILHQSNPDFFQILYRQNVQLLEFKSFNFFLQYFPEAYKIDKLVRLEKIQSLDTLREFRNICFDTQYSIQDILNTANEARQKRNEEKTKARIYQNQVIVLEAKLPAPFLEKLFKFLRLCNHTLERGLRVSLETSLDFFIAQLIGMKKELKSLKSFINIIEKSKWSKKDRTLICFKCFLMFKDGKALIEPGIDLIKSGFFDFLNDAATEVEKIPSLELAEIGNAREQGFMQVITENKSVISEKIEKAIRVLSKLWEFPQSCLLELVHLEYLMKMKPEAIINLLSKEFSLDYIADELERLDKAKMVMEIVFFNQEVLKVGPFSIKIKNAHEMLKNQYSLIRKLFQEKLSSKTLSEISLIEQQEIEIMLIIRHQPKNLEQLNEIKVFLGTHLKEKVDYIEDHLRISFECIEILEKSHMEIDKEITYRAWNAFGIGLRIERTKNICNSIIRRCEKEFAEQLRSNLTEIIEEIDKIRSEFNELKLISDFSQYEEVSKSYGLLKDKIEATSEQCKILNIREGIVGVKSTDFKHLESLKKDFSNFCKLWFFIRDFSYHKPIWMHSNLCDIDSEAVSNEVELYITELKVMLNSTFKENITALTLALNLQKKVSEFSPFVPLLKSLKFPGMKERHWEKINKLTGIPFTKSLQLNLESLHESNILDFEEEIEEISETASREQNLEYSKMRMEKEWESVTFKQVLFKNSGILILAETSEILALLDEHLMKVISMCNSPYADFIEREINHWKNSLFRLQEILDEWEKLQITWMYIYPIFTSPDISNDLPIVAGRFSHVNNQWENLMNIVKNNPVVIEIAWGNPKLLDQIKYARDTLETILKSLYEYLNTKRKAFPRFYFLSNEELLSILSNSRQLETIQKFINKCFEGVDKIVLEENTIVGMESPESEKILFENFVEISSENGLKNVEVWMSALELSMKRTLESVALNCLKAFDGSPGLDWMNQWPSQLLQAVLQVTWTGSVEACLGQSDFSLEPVSNLVSSQLSLLIDLVRADISPNLLNIISTLIILTTHNKDTVSSLKENRVKSASDFNWQAELRYYVIDNKITAKMVDTVKEYGYEYLGNQGRLVITPLTDKCQRILMTSLRLFLGGAPEGPAGTGKTETTKDLAKALAKKCVVFNCSEQLDHTAMGRFFIGLCSCGAWTCFDEFNRIEQEVLSVVAEQIATIQAALVKTSKKFLFDSELVSLDESCAIFITMNPGYAGRSELPDNLKALFRPIAMMIPDYVMISEIFLYSYGFQHSRTLARKLVTAFRLAGEQLSSQKHYDYGMREVTAVIKKAGIFKRQRANDDEEKLLLKAIESITMPKFLPEDLPLLKGILQDLFPSTALNYSPHEILPWVEDAVIDLKLQKSEGFVNKIIELFELIQVRHGNMIVGSPMSGKSTILDVLAHAYYLFKNYTNSYSPRPSHLVSRVWVNPKSMTLDQLYGQNDTSTHDWKDGVLSLNIRLFAESSNENSMKWVELDGPVDALWIENLNTVLDDNKKLCLSSGEIIKFTQGMKMIFEVDDLEQASPATVSRCGMVYLSYDTLGWRCIRDKWISRLPVGYKAPELVQLIIDVFDYFIDPCLVFLKNAQCVVEVNSAWAVKNVIDLMEALMLKSSSNVNEHNESVNDVKNKIDAEKKSTFKKEPSLRETVQQHFLRRRTRKMTRKQTIISEFVVDEAKVGRTEKTELLSFFLFSLTWGIGGFLEEPSKKLFNDLLYRLYNSSLGKGTGAVALECSKKLGSIYQNDSFFTHFYNSEVQNWESWSALLLRIPKERTSDLNFLLVPCTEIVSKMFILNKLIPKGYHSLIIGSSGTGKSSIVKRLISDLEPQRFTSLFNTLSAQTSGNMLQEIIESKLTKRKKNLYGAETGKKCVIVIDDLNMPNKEVYGAQPAIEVLRSAIDKKLWYDLSSLESKNLEDLIYLGIMGLGGRQGVSVRFMRHLFLLTASEYCVDSLETIYKTYLTFAFTHHQPRVVDTIGQITSATIELYQNVVARMPPTPAKSHYLFNIRDITRVFQGVSMVSGHKLHNSMAMYQLWIHECLRVFSDRLVHQDCQLFMTILSKCVDKWIHLKLSEFISGKELLYCNFINDKTYQECSDISVAKQALENILEEFNAKNSQKLEILFFDFAITHLARICRIISTANGHLLLIGKGGNGRNSLCRMAAFLQEYEIFQMQVSNTYGVEEWREDLKSLLFKAGAQNTKLLFLLRDYEITKDIYFENINNILNSGEVPNLFTSDDKENVVDKIREIRGMSTKTSTERWECFLQNTRKNLHVILCMSPVGEGLKKRLRQFPSFTSCCSIDWMNDWPEEALRSVTEKYLKESGITHDIIKQKDMIDICVNIHYSVLASATTYKNETRRTNNLTTSHYLLFLKYIQKLMEHKKGEIIKIRGKYKNGIKKIENTEVEVEKIRQDLIKLKPILEEKTRDTEEILKSVQTKNIEADKTRTLVSQEQKESAVQAEIAAKIKQECEEKLNKAIPELDAAVKALKTLKKDEINEVRMMQKPPYPVKLAVEAVVIINKEKPLKIPDPNDKSIIILDYFEAGKKMMKDSHFIPKLQQFDRDSVTQETIDKLQPIIENPKFEPEMVKKASVAAEGLCKWVRAMYNYYYVNKDVKPKQESLTIAIETMTIKLKLLRDKEFELKIVEEMILELKGQYELNNQEKMKLFNEIKKCEIHLTRAVKLIEKLKSEKERWGGIVNKMKEDMKNLLGDVILAAGMVAYMGNFIGGYREKILQGYWIPVVLGSRTITCSQSFLLKSFLIDELTLQNWHMNNLPNDKGSIENALILEHSIKWPLFIDPQNQAFKWVSKMKQQEKVEFTSTKPGFDEFYKVIENSMLMGKNLWIDGITESLDPILLPLLSVSISKKQNTVKFGDSFKQIDPKFRLFMATTVPNPNFPPETSRQVNIINFTITQDGLTEQLLAIVCKKEIPKETEERNKLVLSSFNYIKKVQDFEDSILQMLQGSGGNILEDEILINSLTESKTMSEETEKKLQSVFVAEQRIIELQGNYYSVASLSALLFFVVSDMQNIDPMYIFSIEWFLNVFIRSVNKAPLAKSQLQRLENLILTFREELYLTISMCLFEKDKLLFSFLIAARLATDFNPSHWRYFLTGMGGNVEKIPNPEPDLIQEKTWTNICELSFLPEFSSIQSQVATNKTEWRKYIDSNTSYEEIPSFNEFCKNIPYPYTDVSSLEKLLLIKTVKPEDLFKGIQSYTKTVLGDLYLKPVIFSMKQAYAESDCQMPIIFILTSGNDPQNMIKNFAHDLGMTIYSISLGKGQGEKASRVLTEFAVSGGWVLLQNCHLMPSWMSELENVIQKLKSDNEQGLGHIHQNFRICLTTNSFPNFPITILQNSVKIINEPPKGIKSNLRGIFQSLISNVEGKDFIQKCSKPEEWQRLLYGLCYFHCLIIERQKFGPLGWNVQYDFSLGDLKVSQRQLKLLVEAYTNPPYTALQYLTGECNYGGRVTDGFDRVVLKSLLSDIYNDDIMYPHFRFKGLSVYKLPNFPCSFDEIFEIIDSYPPEESPLVFGLHLNANVTYSQKLGQYMLDSLTKIESKSAATVVNEKQELLKIFDEISNFLLPEFSVIDVRSKFPIDYHQSFNSFLLQEIQKFNVLTRNVRLTIGKLKKAVEGHIVINNELEVILDSIMKNKVPGLWITYSYLTTKPLMSWVKDLNSRLVFYDDWIVKGYPTVYWFSGFFYPQAFLTSLIQNHSRKNQISIDSLRISIEIIEKTIENSPQNGCFIDGLFLEGARWDPNSMSLEEAFDKVLFMKLPVIWLKPTENTSEIPIKKKIYNCPVYRTPKRTGELTTNGHSNNFVMTLPFTTNINENHWIQRGTAILTQLDD